MASPQKKKAELCPNCYLFEQVEEPLIFRPGSDHMHHCNRGHSYEDKETLENLLMQVNRKRAAIEKAKNPDPEEPEKTGKQLPKALTGTGVLIEKDDKIRIEAILGQEFTDSSSLFGALFSLNEELNDVKANLATLQAAKAAAAAKTPGTGPSAGTIGFQPNGDMTILAVVPEVFASPLKDIAEANGMDAAAYFNDVVENGFKNGWFF